MIRGFRKLLMLLKASVFRMVDGSQRVTIGDRLADGDLVWRLWTGGGTARMR
jgi:hypothetical protein